MNSQPGGSSPLSRGIQLLWRPTQSVFGIIPALAGNTVPGPGLTGMGQDHPRSRGEHNRNRVFKQQVSGSSPLSRGIHSSANRGFLIGRIIPALAGNTRKSKPMGVGGSDHPRSRGEYSGNRISGRKAMGSSPLSRGIQSPCGRSSSPPGIIPALAGNTVTLWAVIIATRDHPRSRGEYCQQPCSSESTRGSSPLSRGIPSSIVIQ